VYSCGNGEQGIYWKPIYNLLEGQFEVLVVNAQHIKAVPGRKTDVRDAEWIADLSQHGLLKPSFIPPSEQRELRDLTQYRRLAARRGRKKALIAVGHSLLVMAYYVLTRKEAYRELSGNYFDERDRQAVERRLVRRLERLGYQVSLQPTTPAA
jgi:transposase